MDSDPKVITQMSGHMTAASVRRLLLSVPTYSDKNDSIPKASGSTAPPHRLATSLGNIKNFYLDDCFVVGTSSMWESS